MGAVEKDATEPNTFTILADQGQPIYSQVTEIAQARKWPVDEFHVQRGQLEDVFRSITQQTGEGA